MEMAGAASLHRWKSPVFRGTGKKERSRGTDLDRPALEVICRDTVINANRKIAGMTGLGGEEKRWVWNFLRYVLSEEHPFFLP